MSDTGVVQELCETLLGAQGEVSSLRGKLSNLEEVIQDLQKVNVARANEIVQLKMQLATYHLPVVLGEPLS